MQQQESSLHCWNQEKTMHLPLSRQCYLLSKVLAMGGGALGGYRPMYDIQTILYWVLLSTTVADLAGASVRGLMSDISL